MLAMLDGWLQRLEFPAAKRLTDARFQIFHGDLLNGGRGELLIVEGD